MKLYVILEQGKEKNYHLSKKHKEVFNTSYSDCYRLNWKEDYDDKYADFFSKDICWSEGRSLLYNYLKNKYLYYVFIDDDIDFYTNNSKSPALELKYLLEKYQPLHGTISNNSWPYLNKKFNKEAYPMIGADLCVQIFHKKYAELVFPTWFHGSGASMWYAQFIAKESFPKKSVIFNSIKAKNTRSEMHEDDNFSKPDLIKLKFAYLLKKRFRKQFLYWDTFTQKSYKKYMQNNQLSLADIPDQLSKYTFRLFRDNSFINKDRVTFNILEKVMIYIKYNLRIINFYFLKILKFRLIHEES